MSYAHTEFLSHSDEKADLIDHLLHVGKKSKDLYLHAKFKNPNIAYYAGLLHDLGKINPWYQLIFHNMKSKKDVNKEYVRKHSIFSAWAAYSLLYKKHQEDLIDKILVLIYGHHTELKHCLGDIKRCELFDKTQREISCKIPEFVSAAKGREEFDELNWELCQNRFGNNMQFDISLKSNESPHDFLDMSYAFSCLLQADRGSFSEWGSNISNFDLHIDSTSQKKSNTVLGDIRTKFQKQVLEKFDTSPIFIINAPTGIGKTKAFLDVVQKFTGNVERVFYFSPLLALTEDFEKKLEDVIKSKSEQKDILIYNHLHSESLAEKRNHERTKSERYNFANESFNKKLIVTTTQRLLMTIFSNKQGDKIKFASLRNSLLIIDEVQTIPKPILANLKSIFDVMNKYMGTRFLLVSATIPHELKEIPKIELPPEIQNDYLRQTKKQISFQHELDVDILPNGKILVMANTRKKAMLRFLEVQQKHDIQNKEIIYMSTGVRKKDRINIIKKLGESESNCILVATQVVEAGVDISFSKIFREEAPLDNIIQVMGRLNREGQDDDACLVIYKTEGESPVPYSLLEYKTTQKKIKGITNSVQIYNILEEYYEEISKKNLTNVTEAEKLKKLIHSMNFQGVWEFVRGKAFADNEYSDPVLVPDIEDWENTKRDILAVGPNNDEKKRDKNKIWKKFGEIAASLPVSVDTVGIEKFDEELMEENIWMPKREYLEEIYDKNTGLDKWLQK